MEYPMSRQNQEGTRSNKVAGVAQSKNEWITSLLRPTSPPPREIRCNHASVQFRGNTC
jgi:hypothetical protein